MYDKIHAASNAPQNYVALYVEVITYVVLVERGAPWKGCFLSLEI